MFKRILWFFFVGVVVFIFIRTFPWDNPSSFIDWLVETSFKVRDFIESLVDWLPFVGDTPADPAPATETPAE